MIDVDYDEPRAFYVENNIPPTRWGPVAKERWEQGVPCARLYGSPTPEQNVAQIRDLAAKLYGTHVRFNLLLLAGDLDSIAESNLRATQLNEIKNSLLSLGARFVTHVEVTGGALLIVQIIHSDFKVEEINYNAGQLWNEKMSN